MRRGVNDRACAKLWLLKAYCLERREHGTKPWRTFVLSIRINYRYVTAITSDALPFLINIASVSCSFIFLHIHYFQFFFFLPPPQSARGLLMRLEIKRGILANVNANVNVRDSQSFGFRYNEFSSSLSIR